MALRAEVIYLVRADIVDNIRDLLRIGEIPKVEEETGIAFVGIDIYPIDPARVERGGPPYEAMHNVPFVEEKFRQV